MIKRDELDKILNKFNSLEQELTTAVNDKEKYVSISKEYAEIKPLAEQINIYLSLLKEHEDLNTALDGNDNVKFKYPTLPGDTLVIETLMLKRKLNILVYDQSINTKI